MDTTTLILMAVAVNAFVIGVLGLLVGMYAVMRVFAVEKATHTVSWVPIDNQIDAENEKFLQQWATSDDRLAEEREFFSEELEEKMPELAPQDEDRETYSF